MNHIYKLKITIYTSCRLATTSLTHILIRNCTDECNQLYIKYFFVLYLKVNSSKYIPDHGILIN